MQTQDAIKQYLLPKKSVLKLEIVQFLLRHDFFISIPYLAKRFNMSESNFKQYIQEIKQDFDAISIDEMKILSQKNFIMLDSLTHDSAYPYYLLFGHYCMASTNYIILSSLFNNQITSVIKLSQETNFSTSYLYTRMKQINDFLTLYGIQIQFSKTGEKVITGNEFQIQYCFLDVYWNIFSNTRLPFQKNTNEQMTALLNQNLRSDVLLSLDSGLIYKLYLLLSISMTNFPYTSLASIREVIGKYPDVQFFLAPESDIIKGEAELSAEQRIIINLLARLSIAKMDSDAENQRQYQLLLDKQVPAFMYSKLLIESFSTTFGLKIPVEKKIRHVFNLLRNRIYNVFFSDTQPNTPMSSESLYKDQPDFLAFKAEMERFYLAFREAHKHYIPDTFGKENLSWIMEDLLHIYDRYKPIKPITIGVNYTRDYYISDDIISKIEQVFSTENIRLQPHFMESCDIVISDCPLTNLPEPIKKIYLLEDLTKPSEWANLFTAIGKAILEMKIRDFN